MLLLFFACSAKSEHPAASASLATTQAQVCSYLKQKEQCLGQITQVIGAAPEMVYAHPMISVDPSKKSIQSYIQIEDQQLIVLSEQTFHCDGTMEVTGILEKIDLGGPEGTRGSYKNYYFSQSTIRCLP